MKSNSTGSKDIKEKREAYIARHEKAEGDKDAIYKQAKDARYRSDIRASKRHRAARRAEIQSQKRHESRTRNNNMLKKAGALAAIAVVTLGAGKGIDGFISDQDRRDNHALNIYENQTGISPAEAVNSSNQAEDSLPQDASKEVTSTIYETAEEAQEAAEEIEENNTGGVGVATAPVEPSSDNPTGGVEVIQIQENKDS